MENYRSLQSSGLTVPNASDDVVTSSAKALGTALDMSPSKIDINMSLNEVNSLIGEQEVTAMTTELPLDLVMSYKLKYEELSRLL